MWARSLTSCALFLVLGSKANQDICPNSTSTYDEYSFLNTVPLSAINKASLVFSVRACEHARIIFTGNTTYFKCSYRIVLGRTNPKGVLESRATVCTSCSELGIPCWTNIAITPGILDCNEFRTFWISIGGGYIEFGTGSNLYGNPIKRIRLFDQISPDYVGKTSLSVYSSRWRFEKEFLPYISPDLHCDTKEMTETEASGDVTTTSDNVTTTSDNVTTTVRSTTSFADEETCECPCKTMTHKWDYLNTLNLTKDELREELSAYLYELQQSISINTKATSKSKSKRESAVDRRYSSVTLGRLGIFIVALIPISFICSDLIRVFKQI